MKIDLKKKFSLSFHERRNYDASANVVYHSLCHGADQYQMIESLLIQKAELAERLNKRILYEPSPPIIVELSFIKTLSFRMRLKLLFKI